MPEERKKGNDCLVVIYTKDPALLGKRFVLTENPTRVGRGPDNQIVLDGVTASLVVTLTGSVVVIMVGGR
ncbi:MAG: hypothetical protein U0165_17935 [Polyangiaceae bacterium]